MTTPRVCLCACRVRFRYDWGGSSNAEPADADKSRVVPICCMSSACACGIHRSSKTVRGPVDWSNPQSVAGSQWFPKYKIKVQSTIMSEAQRPGLRVLELLVINGGPVSQLERRTMPSIVSGAIKDLRSKGVSISMASSGEKTKIVVFLRAIEYTDFIARFDQTMMARDFPEARQEVVDHAIEVAEDGSTVTSTLIADDFDAAWLRAHADEIGGQILKQGHMLKEKDKKLRGTLSNRRLFVLTSRSENFLNLPYLLYHDGDELSTAALKGTLPMAGAEISVQDGRLAVTVSKSLHPKSKNAGTPIYMVSEQSSGDAIAQDLADWEAALREAAAAGAKELDESMVTTEKQLRAAVKRGGEIIVHAGVTIELGATLEIKTDCAIVGGPGGGAPPVLRRKGEGSLIWSEQGKALELRGLRLEAGRAGYGWAVYAKGGRLTARECEVTADIGVEVSNGCQAELHGVTIHSCRWGVVAAGNGMVCTLRGCTLRENGTDCKERDGGKIVREEG
eukprot:COSAG01_NODE_6749_length_3516_cov_5.334504_2_plen_507_part_00